MRHSTTNQLAADIDIDEASGIQHGMEVIRNAVFKRRTNPYLIHEFLLAETRSRVRSTLAIRLPSERRRVEIGSHVRRTHRARAAFRGFLLVAPGVRHWRACVF